MATQLTSLKSFASRQQSTVFKKSSRLSVATKAMTAESDLAASMRAGKRMILMDAMALLYRSHFAFGPDARLRTSSGEDTSVLFGFLNNLLNLLELTPSPTHFAVVFDAPGKNFRHELYPGYKGQRPPTPEPIKESIPKLKALLELASIPQISVAGVEADDVIGTLAMRALMEGIAVAIASPDKDFFQLLRPGLILLRPPSKNAIIGGSRAMRYALVPYTEDNFRNEWELEPAQFIDVLALAGDSSDNVPGVTSIGFKRAVSLLKQFGDVENILKNATQATPKSVAKSLELPESAAAARLSKELVSINTRLDYPPVLRPLEDFRLRVPADEGAAVVEMLAELEFRQHGPRLKDLWQEMVISKG
jgi:DNA polymerase I